MDSAIIIYFIGMTINSVIYMLFLYQIRKKGIKMVHFDFHEVMRTIGLSFFGLVVPFTARYVYPQGNLTIPECLAWLSIPFIILSNIIMLMSYKELGSQCSSTLQIKQEQKQELIKTGIYKYIRHPVYLATILSFISYNILFPNKISIVSSIIAVSILIMSKIPEEEKLLLHEFGFEYIRYMRETVKLIPFLL